MNCEECLPLIEEYVDGELGERLSAPLAAHLATCPYCATTVAELQREQELYALYQREVEVTPAQWTIVRARIEQEKELHRKEPRRRLREWLFGKGRRFRPALVLVLTLIFIGVTAAILYNSRNRGSELAIQPPPPDTVRPPDVPEERRAPGKVNDGDQALASRDDSEKNSSGQTVADNRPRSAREKRTAVAVNKRQPAPQQIRQAPPANAPRLEEARADRDNMMTNTRPRPPLLAGDSDFEIARHAEKAELLLRAFRNVRPAAMNQALDVSYEKEESRKLLYQNISLRRDAVARGDQSAASLLGTLEPILLDIAHLPERTHARDVHPIERRMQRKEIVAALQIRALVAAN